MPATISCEQCGVEFQVDLRRKNEARFCSRDCLTAYRREHPTRKRVRRICEICGVEFKVPPRVVELGKGRFCSHDCRAKWMTTATGENSPHWQGGGVKRKCQICSKTFRVNHGVVKKGHGKYCSRECQAQAQSKIRGELHPSYQGRKVECECEVCGKKFTRATWAIENKNEGRCCSRKCHGIWRSRELVGEKAANWQGGPVVTACLVCGEDVTVSKSRRKEGKGKFCSQECFHTWYSGERAPNWQGGKNEYPREWYGDIKNIIRDRDGHRCKMCGLYESESDYRLSVHHIDRNKQNLEPENLISLCRACHRKAHHSYGYWKPRLQEKTKVERP